MTGPAPSNTLDERDLAPTPWEHFNRWLAEARTERVPQAHAMTLATASPDGVPDARNVLLDRFDMHGLLFHTNLESPKARDLEANPRACVVFNWPQLLRQVRAQGRVEPASRAEGERYFHAQPRDIQVRWSVSHQSQPIASRADLQAALDAFEAAHQGQPLSLPTFYGGLWLLPDWVEFYQGRPAGGSFQDRLRYVRDGDGWRVDRLSP